jgi:hypothetical protein
MENSQRVGFICVLACLLCDVAAHRGGAALGGYDVVAYWSLPHDAEGVLGSEEFAVNFTASDGLAGSDLRWQYKLLFSSAANRDAFEADPYRYLPQWGGFCAWGMSTERSVNYWPWARDYLGPPGGVRNAWFIHDDKLYVTFMPSLISGWVANATEYITVGNARWVEWFGGLQKGPINRDCTADTWWGDTCSLKPQAIEGIPSPQLVTDSCLAAMETVCGAYKEGKAPCTDPSRIANCGDMGPCELCLQANMSSIVATGKCPIAHNSTVFPFQTHPPLSPLVQHTYCW